MTNKGALALLGGEAVDEAAVSFAWFDTGHGLADQLLPAEVGGGLAGVAALVRLGIVGACDGSGGTLIGQGQDLDLVDAAFVPDLQFVALLEDARRLGGLVVAEDASGIAGLRGEGTGFEEASGPEPLVDANACHVLPLPGTIGPVRLRVC